MAVSSASSGSSSRTEKAKRRSDGRLKIGRIRFDESLMYVRLQLGHPAQSWLGQLRRIAGRGFFVRKTHRSPWLAPRQRGGIRRQYST